MSEFVFLYRNGDTSPRSPEQQQKIMQEWGTWMKGLGAKGHLKEAGHPLEAPGRVVRGGGKASTDGPYAEKDMVSGFSVVEAKDLAHASELAAGCPIFNAGGVVEVRPILKMSR
jgi:hypothetical protein